jgi:hypothetical protein
MRARLPSPPSSAHAVTFRRVLLALPSLLLVGPFWATWHGEAVTPLLKMFSAAVFILTAMRPINGLLAVAALLPLATQIRALSSSPFSGAEIAELMLVPFLLVATLRTAAAAETPTTRLGWPALALAAAVLGSAMVGLVNPNPLDVGTSLVGSLLDHHGSTYYSDPARFGQLRTAITWIEALMLAVLAERILRQEPSRRIEATRMLVIGAVAAAAFALLRLSEVSIRTLEPLPTAIRYLKTLRINPHYGDLNAAGSFYVLFLAPALWLAGRRGWRWLLPLTPVSLLALWMTGSRAALGACAASLALAWAAKRRPPPLVLAGGLVMLLLLAALIATQFTQTRATASVAAGIRAELGVIGMRLAASHPAFGVGIGQFKRSSASLITPEFAAAFPSAAAGENAHNQFIQIAAELGLVGLVPLLWLLAVPARDLARALAANAVGAEHLGMACGVLAFLLSCLLGHPLLIVQVLFPFLAALGVTTAWGAEFSPPRSAWTPRIGIAVLGLLMVTLPFRIVHARAATTGDQPRQGSRDLENAPKSNAFSRRLIDTQSASISFQSTSGSTVASR